MQCQYQAVCLSDGAQNIPKMLAKESRKNFIYAPANKQTQY